MTNAGFVSITRPTANQTLGSPVFVVGTCSPFNRTITVNISHAGTVTKSQTVTAGGSTWTTTGIQLASMQNYTASAASGADSDSKPFSTS